MATETMHDYNAHQLLPLRVGLMVMLPRHTLFMRMRMRREKPARKPSLVARKDVVHESL